MSELRQLGVYCLLPAHASRGELAPARVQIPGWPANDDPSFERMTEELRVPGVTVTRAVA